MGLLVAAVATVLLSIAPVSASCGDGTVDVAEECDDGNLARGDGCSAACTFEALATRGDRLCVTSALRRAGRVARTQASLVEKCVRDAAKGREAFPQVCIVLDEAHKVSRATLRLEADYEKRCASSPAWGLTQASDLSSAAIDMVLGLGADLLGPNLNLAVIESDDDRQAVKCQADVLKASHKLMSKELNVFLRCYKAGLLGRRDAPFLSIADLNVCLEALDEDVRGQLTKAQAGIARKFAKRCADLDPGWVLPGVCAGHDDLAECVRDRIDCRFCRAAVRMTGLVIDCDAFDDGELNVSCD